MNNMMLTNSLTELTKEVSDNFSRQISEQLNDLISKGLLVIEKKDPTLVHSSSEDKIEVKQFVKLVLKDKEYIEKLEQELIYLRDWKKRFETLFDTEKTR